MSYILDALRRADAERERGRRRVPDLHAQPLPPEPAADEAPARARPWRALGLGGVAVLVLVLGWRWAASDAPPPAAPPAPPAPVPAEPPAIAQRSAPAPTVSVVATAAPRPSVAAPKAPAAASAASKAPAAGSAASAAAPAASASRIVALGELPAEVRRQLPALAVGGSMYSDNPANRMLIVNGQVFHENDQPAPDVTLEQIRLKSAVLRFKGYRFELSY